MTASDSQVQFSSQQKRRNTLTYRATLDLETEACATLQDSGTFDLRQVSNKSGTPGPLCLSRPSFFLTFSLPNATPLFHRRVRGGGVRER